LILKFCIFLKTKLKIYLFKLPKRRDNFRRLPLLGAKKVKSGRFKLTHRRDIVLQKGDTKKALAAFDSIPAAYKDDPGLNYLHASLLLSAGDLALAREKTDPVRQSAQALASSESEICTPGQH